MLLNLIVFSGFAGVTVFIGGVLANYFNHHIKESPVKYEIIHTLMSFGSGIMLSALALVLIPEGMEQLDLLPIVFSFLFGAILFMIINPSFKISIFIESSKILFFNFSFIFIKAFSIIVLIPNPLMGS